MGGRRILPDARKTRFPDLGVQIRRGPLQATSWHFANIPDHLYTGKRTKMNKTSPVGAFISAANPFSGRFQVFNFQYKDTPGCGRFLARLTHLNRISTERNELELAVCPNFAATPTHFMKIATRQGGYSHTIFVQTIFFSVFQAGVRYIADPFSGRF